MCPFRLLQQVTPCAVCGSHNCKASSARLEHASLNPVLKVALDALNPLPGSAEKVLTAHSSLFFEELSTGITKWSVCLCSAWRDPANEVQADGPTERTGPSQPGCELREKTLGFLSKETGFPGRAPTSGWPRGPRLMSGVWQHKGGCALGVQACDGNGRIFCWPAKGMSLPHALLGSSRNWEGHAHLL